MLDAVIKKIEKGKPFFDKIAQNIYLGAVRDGFLTAMPAILFSSVFILAASIPEIFGIKLPADVSTWLWKVYNYSMGIVGLLVSATTAKCLAESMNRRLPEGKVINTTSVMLASICGFFMLAVSDVKLGISTTYLGTKGLLASFIVAFITVKMYKFCVEKDVTIHMPKEVPGTISQMFRDVFPFSFSVLVCVIIDLIVRNLFGYTFAEAIITLLQPLFTAADGYLGICIIWGAMAMFWFVGVHGPSIVEPAIAAIIYANVDANLALFKAGHQGANVLTVGLGNFVGTMGGTGATLVVPFLFMLFARSKQLKAVGKTTFIPVCFAVNEPLLFATPIVLNPYFFVPFLLAPMVNVSLFKFFVDVLKMNSFIYVLPWATPAPIGLILGTGISFLAVLLAVLLIVVDGIIYLPFVKAYDASLLEEEKQKEALEALEEQVKEEEPETNEPLQLDKKINVLVLCVGAGTSAMFANAVKEGAKETGFPVDATASAYGNHYDILKNYDVVVLSPQVQAHLEEVKQDAKEGTKVIATKGAQYIQLTRDPKGAVEFIVEQEKEG
ncbi:PTS transporter subunit EIIC [Catenibacterium sp. co_0103]|uniref:PTS transporter subunit EIIC n=1 Tax=Catenibacterium sp. co_0103 TaxID=2478954 RepID=UPI00247A1EE2|nr:PTS transporter subunit EIIC [Catenibacterium sp. co_0103]